MSATNITKLFTDANLEENVIFPGDAEYKDRQDSFCSRYAKLEPACIVRPTSPQEVSTIVKTLVAAGQQFAVRSGGHMQWTGANNIQDGITIDLQYLNRMSFDERTNTVDIGPGACWKDVYAELQVHDRMVAGGRNGKVGVAGFLLGGGITFFTGTRGFTCDDVISYEVVLADGRIVTAQANNDYNDLFLALKGGSSNFGIVAKFTIRCSQCEKIWGELRILSRDNTEAALQALQDFTPRVKQDPHANLILMIAYMPAQKDVVAVSALVHVGAVDNAPLYEQIQAIPSLTDMCKMTTITQLVSEYDPVPPG